MFAAFQLMFAIITPALISGSIADRTKFISWSIFATIWTTIVYFPVAHWVFDFGTDGSGGGWLANWGVEDFAGGTAVHINAGAAALALCLVLGKRIGFRKDPMRPHNVPFVLLGAGLLWFGWFGFNAGSALAANNLAGIAFMNTQVATAAALGGLDRGGEDPGRPADQRRRRLRCGGRPGRHHPGVCVPHPADLDPARPDRRRGLCAGRRAEVQARL